MYDLAIWPPRLAPFITDAGLTCQQFSNMRTIREFGKEILTPLILKEYFYDEFQRNREWEKYCPTLGGLDARSVHLYPPAPDRRSGFPAHGSKGVGGGYLLPWSTK